MSYHLSRPIGQVPPPEPTAQALSILVTCAVPLLPVAIGIAGGLSLTPKTAPAVGPIAGALVGTFVSVLLLRNKVLSGSATVVPREA